MKIGDLIKLRPKRAENGIEEYHGILINMTDVGKNGSKTTLYDVLVGEVDQILTVSDIFFDVWRIQ